MMLFSTSLHRRATRPQERMSRSPKCLEYKMTAPVKRGNTTCGRIPLSVRSAGYLPLPRDKHCYRHEYAASRALEVPAYHLLLLGVLLADLAVVRDRSWVLRRFVHCLPPSESRHRYGSEASRLRTSRTWQSSLRREHDE